MKKKKSKIGWVIIILVVILMGMIVIYSNQDTTLATETSTTNSTITKEVEASTQTISKTLSSSGEIASSVTETLALNTYRYFKEIYAEENTFVEEGEKILKYTNGTYLMAPYDCVVTKIAVPEETGDACTSQNYIQVQTTKTLVMTLSVEEEEIGKVAVGQEVDITVNAYEDKTYTGTITKINEIGSYASNGSSFTATVTFSNDGNIKIGMSGSATVTLEKAENVIAVPIEAVQTKNNEKYVVVKNAEGTTENVTVETGISNDAYVEIKSGLTGSETIQMTVKTTTTSSRGQGQMGQGGIESQMGQMKEATIPTMPTGGKGGE